MVCRRNPESLVHAHVMGRVLLGSPGGSAGTPGHHQHPTALPQLRATEGVCSVGPMGQMPSLGLCGSATSIPSSSPALLLPTALI